MDQENLRELEVLRPTQAAAELALFMRFASDAGTEEVPDPYYGGPNGFEYVLDLVEDAAAGLIAELRARSRAI